MKRKSRIAVSRWERAPLGALGALTGGGTPTRAVKEYYQGSIPWITVKDLQEDRYTVSGAQEHITEEAVARSATNLIPAGAVIVATRVGLGKIAINTVPIAINQDLKAFRPSRRVRADYVLFALKEVMFEILKYGQGTTVRGIRQDDLLSVEIPLPPLPVQERIVEILRKGDEVRRKGQDGLHLAEAILLSLFIHVFGDPLENARGFPMKPLGELSNVKSGVTKGRALDGKDTTEARYLRVANVQDGYLDLSEIKTITVLPGDIEKYRLELGDVLMTEGGDPDKLGRGCIWHEEVPGCIYQNHIFRVRTDHERLAPEYLAALLRTRYAKDYFLRCAKRSSNLASINSTQVKAFPVPLAPKHLQDRFVEAVSRWQEIGSRLTETLRAASATSRSLLNHAFNGELTEVWEATHSETIHALQALHGRLPQLILLGFLNERARRVARRAGASELWLTALMEYAFLLQMEGAAKAQLYCFVPYHYGPFAKEIYSDLEALREQGLVAIEPREEGALEKAGDDPGLLRIAETIAPNGGRKPRKIKTPRMVITIADPKAADRALRDLPAALQEDIRDILGAYGDLGHKALLDTVYEKYPAFAKKSRLKRTAGKNPCKKEIRRRRKQ